MGIAINSGRGQEIRGSAAPKASRSSIRSSDSADSAVSKTEDEAYLVYDAKAWLEELRKKFPGGGTDSCDLSDPRDLQRYAQEHLGGLQFVLSPEALKRIETDGEFRKKCEELLIKTRKSLYTEAARLTAAGRQVLGAGMFIDKDGNVSQWIASQEKQPPKLPEHYSPGYQPFVPPISTGSTMDGTISRFQGKDGKRYVIKKNISYRPAMDLAKLAKARNQQMVKTTISSIRASIYRLRTAGGEDKKVAKQLANQAEQVLLKAQTKVKQLKKEELMEVAQKNAERENQLRRAASIKRMLEEKRVRRTVREHGQIHDYYPTPQEIRREEEKAKEWAEQVTGVNMGNTITTGLQSYTPTGAAAGVPDITAATGGSAVFIDITL